MEFWRFVGSQHGLGIELESSYDPALVVLSLLVASLAAFTAQSVVDRIKAANQQKVIRNWLVVGSVVMGIGIWSMHFIAMLAFSLPVQIGYKLSITILSVIPAIIGSGCALYFMSRRTNNWLNIQIGALLMAVGIGTMHYTGMEALYVNALMRYDPTLFAISILVAHLLAVVSFYVRFLVSQFSLRLVLLAKVGGAVVMGIAVGGMHYTAMSATICFPSDNTTQEFFSLLPPSEMGVTIAIFTTVIVGVAIIATMMDRRLGDASTAVLKSNAFSQLLLKSAGEGIYGLDTNGLTTFINPTATKMIGWSQDELIGQPQHDIMHHTRSDGTQYPHEKCPIYAAIYDGEIHHVNDEVFWRKDGSSFPVEYISTPVIEDEKIIGAVVVFRDISERKLNEQRTQRLLISQEVLNAIHQISFEPIPLEEQLKKSLEEILSIPWLFIQSKGAIFLTKGQDQTELKMVVQEGLHNSLLRDCDVVPFGYCICGRAAKSKVIVHVDCIDDRHDITFDGIQPHGHYAVPILSGQDLLGVLTLYLDEGHTQNSEEINLLLSIANSLSSMIERKRGEDTLININQELEERVRDRTVELHDYVENLKEAQEHLIQSERMAALGGLVAGVAHEINTPVGIGFTASSYLRTTTQKFQLKVKEGGLSVEDLDTYLESVNSSTNLIINNLDRAGELVKSFKSVAVDQTSQEKRTFNLKDYINEILLSLHPKLKRTKHTVKVQCPDKFKLDNFPGALSQIITNLVENSMIYGFEGIESGDITISVAVANDIVSLSYSDNGVGMKKKTVKQLYEPFFTTKRNQGGSGLGMHIVFNLVTHKLKGTIECHSAKGKGTRFDITFPGNA
jgi:PAS domain S-box-containing protein